MNSAPPTTTTPSAATTTERPLAGLVKHSAIYSAAPILRQLISVGMSPLYTTWLGPAGAGVKENADLWGIALQQILGQNVLGSMVRFYYDQKEERERGAVVTSCTLLILVVAFVLCGSALFFVPWLTPLLLGRGEVISSSELERVCTLMLVLVPFQLATVSGNYYLFTVKRSRLFTSIQMAKLVFEVGMNVYLMGVLGMGVTGFLLSMLAGEVLTSAGLVGWMLVRLGPRIERAQLRPILRYAMPLVPVGLLQLLLHQGDKRIVLEVLGQEAAGIYGFGFKIAMMVTNMVLGPFIVSWQPWIFGIEDTEERARLVARVSTYAVMAIAVASLGVILFGRQAAFLLGAASFHSAYRVVPFVAAGYVFWALYNVSQTPMFLAKRTGPLLLVNLGAVALNVRLNLWLVPEYGIVGASVTVLLTFAALAALGMNVSRRAAGVHFEFGRLLAILACVTAGGAVALWIDTLEDGGRLAQWLAMAVKGTTLIALALVLWTMVLFAEERARFRTWMRSRLARA